MESLSVIVPVYNGGQTIENLCQQLICFLKEKVNQFEIILVDDFSKDISWEIIKKICSENSNVTGYRMNRNFGQHNAILYGIRNAKNKFILTLDDDLQHPVEEILKLMQKLNEGHDVVYGAPLKEKHGLLRNLCSFIIKIFMERILKVKNATDVSAFRIFRTSLREAFDGYEGPTVSIDVLLTWATTRITSIKVHRNKREKGESNYTITKLIVHTLNMITGFSTFPLQVASFIGLLCTLLGVFLLIYVLIIYMKNGGAVPGFSFLASIIVIFSGAQMFTIGIMGEYLARIYTRSIKKPQYLILDKTSNYDQNVS